MIVRSDARWARAALMITLMTAPACLRHSGIMPGGGASQPQATQSPAGDNKPVASPDTSWHEVFQQQIEGAYNPLTDDMRIRGLQNRSKPQPQDIAIRLELAEAYEAYRFYDDAWEQYSSALQLIRSAPETTPPAAEKAAVGLGRCARASGRAEQAVPMLEAALKDRPSAGSWDELGLLYDSVGNHAAGENAFREAVARDPAANRLHNNLGYNLLLQNKTEAAESEFRKALELDPKSATSHNNLGVVLARRGDLRRALEQFQAAAEPAAAHNNLAVVLFEMGRYEQSRAELVKALTVRPYFAPALANFRLVQERIRERAGTVESAPRNEQQEKQPGAPKKPPQEKK